MCSLMLTYYPICIEKKVPTEEEMQRWKYGY